MIDRSRHDDAKAPPHSPWRPVIYALVLAVAFVIATNSHPVVLPLVVALALTLISFPAHHWLKSRIGVFGSAATLFASYILAFLILAASLAFIGDQVIDHFRDRSDDYRDRYVELRDTVVSWGVSERLVPDPWGGDSSDESAEDESSGSADERTRDDRSQRRIEDIVAFATSGVGEMLSFLVLIGLGMGLATLLLVESERWIAFARRHLDDDRFEALSNALRGSGVDIRRHFGVKTITGLLTGVATGLTTWAFGLPLAITWGVLTFLMNYIPNVGALLSAIPPVLVALLLEGVGSALGLAAALLIIENAAGMFIEPKLEGHALPVSPFFALLSLILWGWLLGAVGVLLAVPLTAVVVRFGWLTVSDRSIRGAAQTAVRPDPPERFNRPPGDDR